MSVDVTYNKSKKISVILLKGIAIKLIMHYRKKSLIKNMVKMRYHVTERGNFSRNDIITFQKK